MALVQNDYYLLTATVQDRENNKSDVSFRVDLALDITDLLTAIPTTFIPLIDALTDGVIVGWGLSLGAIETAPAAAPSTSDVERKGTFMFRDTAGRPVTVQVPSISNALVVAGDNALDLTATAVDNFIDAMVGGTIFGALAPQSAAGNDISRFIDARKRHRKSSKG